MATTISASTDETVAVGRAIAATLRRCDVLALCGDLGAGKTCFIKGLARGLSLREEDILSPTFTMIQEHHGRFPLYHIDLYRLEEATLDDLERRYLQRALDRTGGVQTKAAELLRMTFRQFRYKLQKHSLAKRGAAGDE